MAQPLSPDPDFGNNGIAVCQLSGRTNVAHDLVQQPDARILAAGMTYTNDGQLYYESLVTRFLANGQLDNSFGQNGSVKLVTGNKNAAYAVKLQADGKILVAGNETIMIPQGSGVIIISKPFVARLNASGTLDNSFGNNGIHGLDVLNSYLDRSVSSLVVLPDGRILIGGNIFTGSMHKMLLVCLKADGTYDAGFGNSGVLDYTLESGEDATLMDMALQEDGKVVLAGASGLANFIEPPNTKIALLRINGNGMPDPGFGNQGIVLTQISVNTVNPLDIATRIKVLPGGRLCIAGQAGANLAMARYLPDGALDPGFGQNGFVVHEGHLPPTGFAISDGKLYTCGSEQGSNDELTVNVSGFHADGEANTAIGPDAIYKPVAYQRNYTHAMIAQADGKLLVAGSFKDANDERGTLLIRLKTNTATGIGSPDGQLQAVMLYPNPATDEITLLREGQVIGTKDRFTVINALGQVVYSGSCTGQKTVIPVGSLSPGNYMLRLTGTGYSQVQKFQKIR
jgi:uncharacterized delta-60 repeat protein